MAVLDRSWYGRVLVERVEGFAIRGGPGSGPTARSSTWRRTLAAEGTILVKFWMHVSPEEQLRRFERRDDPYKTWKLTDDDWRNREKRADYEAAVEDMLERTDHPAGPWHVVAADDKRWARVDVVRTVCEAMEEALAEPRHRPRPAAGTRAVLTPGAPGRRAGGSRRASRCRRRPRR